MMCIMDKTVPSSFRPALAMEEEEAEWNKPFRNALDRSDRKKFDDEMLFDIPRLYISQLALLYAIQPVRLYPILLMSILLYCYKQLIKCAKQVEQIMVAIGIGKEEEVYHHNERVSN